MIIKNYRYKLVLILLFLISKINLYSNEPISNSSSQSNQEGISYISDGPYIFYSDDKIVVKWVYENYAYRKTIRNNKIKFIHRNFNLDLEIDWILNEPNIKPEFKQEYNNVKDLIAISDIHGQYDVFIKLLQQYKVIDKDLKWIFGSGHLVILGDIMDRGPKVTESLWLVYQLEKQAEKSGGKVHFILGNHELMVVNNDARYINPKYLESSSLLNTTYDKLFSANTLLGSWLRRRPVMVKINDILFVHAGISVDFIKQNLNIEETNKLFMNKIIGNSWDNILNDSTLTFMTGDYGPIWYRGYFTDFYLKEYQIDHILRYYNSKHIIVGHTSLPNITSIYDKKIMGIDSNIKMGDYGELLIIKNNEFFRGTTNGTLIKF